MDKKTQGTAKIVIGTTLLTFVLMGLIHAYQPMDLDKTLGLND
ncbi:hypothetical protein RJD40_01600 [Vibrio scophthalmi]